MYISFLDAKTDYHNFIAFVWYIGSVLYVYAE